MSELDTKLTELREDLRAAITPPDLAQVTGRARQRTVRRRMQVGAVAAVVAVSVAVPVLRSLPGERAPAHPPVPASMTFEVDFADPDHGYALGSDCQEPAGSCELALFASPDGGRSWERRPLPEDGERYAWGRLTVLDADRLTIERVAESDQLVARIVSTDRGRTWHDGMLGGVAAPAPLPDDAWVQAVCVGQEPNGDCRVGIGALSLDGGEMTPAPAQPPLVEPQVGRTMTPGGRYWAVGVDRGTGRWTIAVTGNGGATWLTTPVAVPGEPSMNDAWAVVEADGVMYATMQGAIAKGPFGLLAVFRSTDGGETWTSTWRATADTVLQAVLGTPVATADGRLLVYSAATGTYESRDGGRSFTKASHQLPGEVVWTRAGYVAKGDGHGYTVSRDGVEWRDFRIG
jgi:photosystem II stability/assembly factor-like uncharacterized protein